jgi:hypothetical protein
MCRLYLAPMVSLSRLRSLSLYRWIRGPVLMQLFWETGGAVRVAGVVSTVFVQGQNVESDIRCLDCHPEVCVGGVCSWGVCFMLRHVLLPSSPSIVT